LTWAARAAFAESDFNQAIRLVTQLAETYPKSPELASGYLIQGEALMELGRFDEAILVLERVLLEDQTEPATRHQAEVLKADALFALGADNPARYQEALDAYRAVRQGESLSPGMRLAVSFKMGRTFEKLKRTDEAIDQYYTGVVLAYREGRQKGVKFDDEARAAFARAAFRLADEYESRGRDFQAMHILELVIASDVPAADEAEKRLDRIQTKGKFL
jgi:tetratricopeptide (TPR) repeat protein